MPDGEVNKELERKVEMKAIALEWVKDENEVNKKNMFKFMKEARELREENEKLKEEIEEWRGCRSWFYPYTIETPDDLCYVSDDIEKQLDEQQREIDRLCLKVHRLQVKVEADDV